MQNLQTALSIIADAANQSRDLVREALEYVVTNRSQLTDDVAVELTPEELTSPAFENILANSFCPCACGRETCGAQYVRVIEAPVNFSAGNTVVIGGDGKKVYVRVVGSDVVAQIFEVDAAEGALVITTPRGPVGFSLAGIQEQLATLPADDKTRLQFARKGDGKVAICRIDSVDAEAGTATLTLSTEAEVVEARENLTDGETINVAAGKTVYLRAKGAGEGDALRSLAVENGELVVEKNPLSPARFMSGGPAAYDLAELSEALTTVTPEQRTFKTTARTGLPQPLFRIDAVGLEAGTVTIVLDSEIEAYEPSAETIEGANANPFAGGGLGALLGGGVQVLDMSQLAALLGGELGGPEGEDDGGPDGSANIQ